MPTDRTPAGTRPYVLISAAISLDGYLDDTSNQRLRLSNPDDFDRVDAVRADCDAILVGATTIRRDNPRLLIASPTRRAHRAAQGRPEHPTKITLTTKGLDPSLAFFTTAGDKIVYCPQPALPALKKELADVADVTTTGNPLDLGLILDDLAGRGIRTLMVEGGGTIHTQFLTQDLVDEIHLAIAPFFVGEPGAPRFVGHGTFPHNPARRMHIAEVRQIGDIALVRYLAAHRR
ncbi:MULTISPECIES: dihydrofolate reductase family protein [unclassified Streptomyces]|uniref:RibD family protein n=1 Tax=unclassified Streptomyces TaxID=2593676 RepID=UPI000C2762F9|nr:dihydrofolate reductase family protein [Streptomyces sp. CB02959]PJN33474.1 deaminase [Streptomyces sp. CB02959]